MDKYEYNLKLEEIDKLVDQGDYEEAANLADTIEWRRVRNVRTMCLISEIYEAAGKLDKSKEMLVRAYRKSPVGRNVLHRLIEVTTALGQYDEALEYYAEYVQTAPHDNNRYILKYKIYRGRGSSTEELIAILEEYLGQEYTERWAYELATLYQEAGQIQKCMATCDDLVLWFHTGKYVKKALEIKKRYAVLTPKQQQIYEICQQEEAQSEYFEDAEDDATVVRSTEAADGEVLAENIMAETEKEIAGEIIARKAEKEKGRQSEASQKSSEPNLLAKVFRKGADLKRPLKNTKKEMGSASEAAADGKAGRESTAATQKTGGRSDTQEAGKAAAGQKGGDVSAPEGRGDMPYTPDRPGKGGNSLHAAPEQELTLITYEDEDESSEYDDLQVELAKSVRKVISGVARKPELNEDDVPVAVEERLRDIQEICERREPEPTPGKLSIDDILLSMGEKGKQAAAAARAQREAEAAMEAESAATAEPEETIAVNEPELMAATESEGIEAAGEAESVATVEPEGMEAVSEPELIAAAKSEGPKTADETEELMAAVESEGTEAVSESELIAAAEPGETEESGETEEPVATVESEGTEAISEPELMAAAEPEEIETTSEAEPAVTMESEKTEGTRQTAEPASESDKTAGITGVRKETARTLRAMSAPTEAAAQATAAAEDDRSAVVKGKDERLKASGDFSGSTPVRTVTAAEAEGLPPEQLEALKYSSNPEKLLRNRNSLPTYTSEADFGKTRKISTKEDLLEAARKELMMTQTIRIPAEEVAKAHSRHTDDLPATEIGANAENFPYDKTERNRENRESAGLADESYADQAGLADESYADQTGLADENYTDQAGLADEGYADQAGLGEESYADQVEMPDDRATDDSQDLREELEEEESEEEEPEEYFDDPLTIEPRLRGLFEGFTEIEGLEDQIANAILQAMAKGTDRTSRNGNILIFGSHGSGKTTLATGLAKAIAQEKGRKTAKMARIYAVDLNRRDIAATIAKIAGGTLIIEEAGDLADDTVDQLTTAMEFRTDGLIVILEDEQRYIHNLLMKHPRFTMKFTAQIYLPVYTADELAMFALRHAREQDYSISEDGFDALRQKVAEKSATETPMSVGDIVELVDRAIRHSNKFMRKMSMGKKRYDEEDYVLLFAKDFK